MDARGRRFGAPAAPVNVVVQDRKNRNLLVVGNDKGVFVSIDAGAHWSRLKANRPTVAVHDLTIHPRENDLVIATYGRALWTGDISPLQALSAAVLDAPMHLFDIRPRRVYGFGLQGMNYELYGNKFIRVPNETDGLVINYYVKTGMTTAARLTISDTTGRVVRQIDGPSKAGLNRVAWTAGGRGGATPPSPGDYQVTLEIGGEKVTKLARVK